MNQRETVITIYRYFIKFSFSVKRHRLAYQKCLGLNLAVYRIVVARLLSNKKYIIMRVDVVVILIRNYYYF